MLELAVGSLEYVKVPVSAVVNGVPKDPTTDTIQMAFPLLGADVSTATWRAASWETDAAGVHWARCLVGPGGTQVFTPGLYHVWLKIADAPEAPIKRVGQVRFY